MRSLMDRIDTLCYTLRTIQYITDGLTHEIIIIDYIFMNVIKILSTGYWSVVAVILLIINDFRCIHNDDKNIFIVEI